MSVYLAGVGAYLPNRIASNEAFASIAGIDPESVQKRAGIEERYIAQRGVGTEHMASAAAAEALAQEPAAAKRVGMVLAVSAFHPSYPGPSTAESLKTRLRMSDAVGMDICSARSGFVDALKLGYDAVENRTVGAVLLVGAEGFSNATLFRDRRTSSLLSDGAGAFLLSDGPGFARVGEIEKLRLPSPDKAEEPAAQRVGLLEPIERALSEGARRGTLHVIAQQPELARGARELPEGVKVCTSFASSGLFLSATLPLTLYRLLGSGEIKRGDSVLFVGLNTFGAYSTCLLEIESLPVDATGRRKQFVPRESGAPGAEPAIIEAGASEITAAIATELRAASGELSCIALRFGGPAEQAPELMNSAQKELQKTLLRHARQADTLLKLSDSGSYALLLRYVHAEDGSRICTRLRSVIEHLDLGGATGFTASARCFTAEPFRSPDAFSEEIVRFLSEK